MNTEKKTLKSILAIILALILAVGALPFSASAADTSTAGQTKVILKLGKLLDYGPNINWATHMMYADDKMAYCVNPALPAPTGTFTTTDNNCVPLTSKNTKNYNSLVKALYYCYGGDGFSTKLTATGNKTMKAYMDSLRTTDWGIVLLNPKGNDLYYLLTHRVLAKFYGDADWAYALPQSWIDAVNSVAGVINKAPDAPSTTELYLLNTGNSKFQKVILAKNKIKIQLRKSSSNTELTQGNSCYSLAGAVYDIYLDKDCKTYFGSITTDERGYAQYGSGNYGSDVPLQTYYAKEVTAPKGYALDTKSVYEFKDSGTTTKEGKHIYVVNCTDIPQNDPVAVLLKKTDKNGKGLEGAEFTINYYNNFYYTESEIKGVKPTRSWVFKTDSDGDVYFDNDHLISGSEFYYPPNNPDPALPLGTVTIQETKAPDGYIIDDTLFIRQITSSSSGESVFTYNAPEIPNEPNPGKLKIVKTSDDGIVSGIQFIVKNNETGEEKTYTTGANGTIIEDYYAGSYTITEVVDETRYYPQEPQTVTVDAGETKEVKFHNRQTTDGLTIKKYSSDGNVSGIKFYIKDNTSGSVIEKVTDANGYITVDGLTIGKIYTITEEVPEGYEPQSPKTVKIVEGGNFVTFTNTPQFGNLLIKKTCDNGKRKGFSFTVQKVDENGKLIEWLTPQWGVETDANGEIRFDNIPVGYYRVSEVGGWDSFYENPEPVKTIKVEKGKTGEYKTVEFENQEIKRHIKIVKNSADGNVSGIIFKVTGYFGDNPQKITKEFITDENGIISEDFPVSDFGEEYTIEEVVPEGYEPQEAQTIYFDFDIPDDSVTEVKFTNIRIPEVKLIKTSDDGKVEGIPFVISCENADGSISSERKLTDANGNIVFDKIAGKPLENGREYTVTEEVPDGYAEQKPQTVTAVSGEVAEVKFHNNVLTDLKIVKTSEDGIIEGIYFEVRADGSLVGRYATDNSGVIALTDLPAYRNGRLLTYSVRELGVKNSDGTFTVPSRYVTPTAQSKTLVASESENNIIAFEFENILKRGNITIQKRGTSNPTKPISCVVMNIYDSSGNLLLFSKNADGYVENENGSSDIVTDSAGRAKILNLVYDDYTVKEIKAASGYNLLKEGVTITLQSSNMTKIIHNTEKPIFPNAGSNDKIIWYVSGGLVVLIGLLVFVKKIKRNGNERKSKMSKIQKYSKNCMTIVLAMLMIVSTIFVGTIGAGAANPYHIDETKTGSISFYKYEMNDASTATTPGDGTVKELPDGATPLEGVEFTAYQISDLEGIYTYMGKALPTPTEAEAMIGNVPSSKTHSAVTDENGYIKLSDLPLGIYYVKETFSPSQVREKTASFVVSIPTTSPDGTQWMYDITVQPKNETKYADVTVFKTDNESGAALGGFGFTLEEKIVTKAKPNGTWTPVATTGSVGTTGGVAPTGATWITAENGKFTINHLATDRAYRFKEVSATDKQYIVDPTVYYDFTVNADGTVTYDSSNFKNTEPAADNTLEITNETVEVHKSVSTDKTNWMQDVTQDINKTVYWKVSADIPTIVSKLSTYKITDTLSKGLTYNSIEIKVEADGEAISKNDYTVTTSKGTDGETVIVVDIKNKNTLAGHKVCDVILTTTLNESAVIGGDNPNTAKLTYSNFITSNTTYEKTTETPEVHTGGYTLLKKDIAGNALAGAEFSVYRTIDDAKNGTNAITFEKGTDGNYYMSTAPEASESVVSGTDGYVTVLGLLYGENGLTSANGSTTYYVAETKAPNGYNLLKEPFEITVTATSHNYKDGTNVDVVNTPEAEFPLTGSQAAMIFGIGGAAVIGIGAIVFLKKRKNDDSKCGEK